jgi:hypothetical protein
MYNSSIFSNKYKKFLFHPSDWLLVLCIINQEEAWHKEGFKWLLVLCIINQEEAWHKEDADKRV